jgi:hypothetical protein
MGRSQPKIGFRVRIRSIGEHTLVLLLILVSIWLVRKALDGLLGGDAKLFRLVQIEYITDFADLLALIKYLWALITDFRR